MFNFPWTNFHELNLDWILSVVKEAKEIFDNGRSDIDYAVSTADEAKEIATQAAESTIPDNSVSTQKIQDYAVNADKLSNYSVTEAKLQNGAVTNAKIADNAINTNKIADGAITESKLNSALANKLFGIINAPLTTTKGTLTNWSRVFKTGNVVNLTFRMTASENIGAYSEIATIPADYCPSTARNFEVAAQYGTTLKPEQVQILNTGVIRANDPITSGQDFGFTVTYII